MRKENETRVVEQYISLVNICIYRYIQYTVLYIVWVNSTLYATYCSKRYIFSVFTFIIYINQEEITKTYKRPLLIVVMIFKKKHRPLNDIFVIKLGNTEIIWYQIRNQQNDPNPAGSRSTTLNDSNQQIRKSEEETRTFVWLNKQYTVKKQFGKT